MQLQIIQQLFYCKNSLKAAVMLVLNLIIDSLCHKKDGTQMKQSQQSNPKNCLNQIIFRLLPTKVVKKMIACYFVIFLPLLFGNGIFHKLLIITDGNLLSVINQMQKYNCKQISSKYRLQKKKDTEIKTIMSARYLGTGNFKTQIVKQRKCLQPFGLTRKKFSTALSFQQDETCYRCQSTSATLQCLQCRSKYFCRDCWQQIHKIGKFQFHTTKMKENSISGLLQAIRSEKRLKKYDQQETSENIGLKRLHNNVSKNKQQLTIEQQKLNRQIVIQEQNLSIKNQQVQRLFITQHFQSIIAIIKAKILQIKLQLDEKQQELINNAKNNLKNTIQSFSTQNTQNKNKRLNKSTCPSLKSSTEIETIPLIQFGKSVNKKNDTLKFNTQSTVFKQLILPQLNQKNFSQTKEFISKLSWKNITQQALDGKNLYTQRSPKNERKNLRSYNNAFESKNGLTIKTQTDNSNQILLFSPKFSSNILKKQCSKSFIAKIDKDKSISNPQEQKMSFKWKNQEKKQKMAILDMTSPKNQASLSGRVTKRFGFPFKP